MSRMKKTALDSTNLMRKSPSTHKMITDKELLALPLKRRVNEKISIFLVTLIKRRLRIRKLSSCRLSKAS
jgi:hypothetical protein